MMQKIMLATLCTLIYLMVQSFRRKQRLSVSHHFVGLLPKCYAISQPQSSGQIPKPNTTPDKTNDIIFGKTLAQIINTNENQVVSSENSEERGPLEAAEFLDWRINSLSKREGSPYL